MAEIVTKKSPKTTALGIIAILLAVLGVAQHALSGTFSQIDFPTVIASISAGVGLIVAGDAKGTETVTQEPPKA